MRKNRNQLLFPIILSGLFFLLPVFALLAFGFGVLWQSQWLNYWLLGTAVCALCGWLVFAAASSSAKRKFKANSLELVEQVTVEPFWGPLELSVWLEVQAVAARISSGEREIASFEQLSALAREILDLVARSFHPTAKNPQLEVKLADVLIVLEQAVREVRQVYLQSVPLHNVFTVGDMLRVKSTVDFSSSLYSLYRLLRAVSNPLASVIAELRDLFSKQAAKKLSTDASLWILARFVETAGKHLINLYSGQVVEDIEQINRVAVDALGGEVPALDQQCLRILLLGQTGAGKSSLVNALFGEMRSVVDVLPETKSLLVFEKTIAGVGRVEIIDSPGYGEAANSGTAKKSESVWDSGNELLNEKILARVDLVVLVLSATNAARQEDAKLCELYRERSKKLPREVSPPLVAVLNKIDLLRPLKHWHPPYNVLSPELHESEEDRQKAKNIADCILTVAAELALAPDQIVPISMATAGEEYNIDLLELILTELLPGARKVLLRRLIRNYKEEKYWQDIRKSLESSGAFLLKTSFAACIEGIKQVSKHLENTRGRG